MKPQKIVMVGSTLRQQGGVASVEKLILRYVPPAEVEIQHISTHEESSIARRLMVFAWGLGKLAYSLQQPQTDLVHIHFTERGSAFRKAIATTIARAFRKPIILHTHGSEFHTFYAKLPPAIQQLMARIFRQSTYFIVLSESWKTFYISNLGLKPEQVVVLPNPVEIVSNVPHRIGCEVVNFIFLGRIGQRKGAFDLIQAIAKISGDRQAKFKLIMAGDGEVEQARQLVKNLDLTERITVLDWIDSEQRNELLAKANVFILPSYNEGLPMALLEAMSWGLPAITTPVGGIPEVVSHGETGLLVNPGNIEQLAEAMQSLIDNEELRLFLGSNARTRVAAFDIKTYCDFLMHLYRSALDDKPREL